MKPHLFGALIIGSLVSLPAAAATTLHVTQAGFYNSSTVNASGPGPGNGNLTAANFRYQGNFGWGGTFDVYAFCVDLAHTVSLGNGVQADVNYWYEIDTLTSAPGLGGSLTAAQLQQMKGLASEGFRLLKLNDPNLATKIPAIQSAIWSIEYGKTITSSNPTINGLISSYITLAPSLKGMNVSYLRSLDNPERQGVFISYVPEPGTWAMLIAGFGLVGAAARRRKAAPLATAAA